MRFLRAVSAPRPAPSLSPSLLPRLSQRPTPLLGGIMPCHLNKQWKGCEEFRIRFPFSIVFAMLRLIWCKFLRKNNSTSNMMMCPSWSDSDIHHLKIACGKALFARKFIWMVMNMVHEGFLREWHQIVCANFRGTTVIVEWFGSPSKLCRITSLRLLFH